jgi:hypothetical protein
MEEETSLPCLQEPATDPYPNPDEFNPHTLPPHFPKINFNINLQSMPRSSEWSLSFRLSDQNFVLLCRLTMNVARTTHLALFDLMSRYLLKSKNGFRLKAVPALQEDRTHAKVHPCFK